MGLFGKKRPDFVDLTDMRKRGILRERRSNNADSSGVLDLSSSGNSSSGSDGLGFLGSLAGAGSSQANPNSNETYGERLRAARRGNMAEFRNMKVKIEDIEYKMDRFLERLEKIEDKLND